MGAASTDTDTAQHDLITRSDSAGPLSHHRGGTINGAAVN